MPGGRVRGPLEPFAAGYRAELARLGYTPASALNQMLLMAQLSRWLVAVGVSPGELTADREREFCEARRAAGQTRVPTRRSLASLMSYLNGQGVVPSPSAVSGTTLDRLLDCYREWMIAERGLAPATVLRYEKLARRFLGERSNGDLDTGVDGLTGADVAAFLLKDSTRFSVGAVKGRVAELRSLLRFLHVAGFIPTALAEAVPPVAGWHDSGLPIGVAPDDIQAMLDSCDRSHRTGLRDYAILLLLVRLGLRSVEVARLEIGDIDWRAGEMTVRGKARRDDRMPLPADVGEAIAAYLTQARPRVEFRTLFVTCAAPLRPIIPQLVGDVARHACERAGVVAVGPHRLRHALATQLLQQGGDLVEISQVLRHRDLATTAIYAKVDLGALRAVAQPWPGADR